MIHHVKVYQVLFFAGKGELAGTMSSLSVWT